MIRRFRLILAMAVGLLFLLLPTIPAHAGGGCHNTAVRDVVGTRVDLRDMCFVQTILRVKAGQAVTWKNSDGTEHTVTGVAASWGSYDPLLPGKSVTHRFGNDGIYPYFCLLHPGMVGVVVVGDGGKASSAETSGAGVSTVTGPGSDTQAAPAAAKVRTNPVSSSSPGPWRTVALVTLGLLVATGAAFAAQRMGLRRSHARARVS
jgi:plastocyanin